MKWNKCSKSLPPEDGQYLIVQNLFDVTQMIKTCYFTDDLHEMDELDFPDEQRPGFYDYDSEYGHYECTNVTHWMELPPLPEGD